MRLRHHLVTEKRTQHPPTPEATGGTGLARGGRRPTVESSALPALPPVIPQGKHREFGGEKGVQLKEKCRD